MSILDIVINLIHWILTLAGVVGVIGMLPFIITGIIFLVKYSEEKEIKKKKSYIRRGILFIVLPFALIIGSIVLVTALAVIKFLIGMES